MTYSTLHNCDYQLDGLSFTVRILQDESNNYFAEFNVTEGHMDVNALWFSNNDANVDGDITLSPQDSSLNMNGSQLDGQFVVWDDYTKLSSPGLGPDGINKETYLTSGETKIFQLNDIPDNITSDYFNVIGIRATTTSTPEGSIKAVDDCKDVPPDDHQDCVIPERPECGPSSSDDCGPVDCDKPGITIQGTNGNDTLSGTGGKDNIFGQNGDDHISGGEGKDTIDGGAGNDEVCAGKCDDTVYGGDGNDTLFGNSSNDSLYGENGSDFLLGGKGDDLIDGGAGNDTIWGDTGIDVIHGGNGDDLILGGEGNDTLFGDQGNDIIKAGKGDDIIDGGLGNDKMYGNSGNDIFNNLNSSNNLASGGSGNDIFNYDFTNHSDALSVSGGSDYDRLNIDMSAASNPWSLKITLGSTMINITDGNITSIAGSNYLSINDATDLLSLANQSGTIEMQQGLITETINFDGLEQISWA